ncbi:MAG: hypothetical protein WBE34_08365, partial [Candidatus Nitrosopolaris sp.]
MRPKQEKTTRNKTPTEARIAKTKGITVANVLKSISDPISVELFKSVSAAGSESSALRSKSKLSR